MIHECNDHFHRYHKLNNDDGMGIVEILLWGVLCKLFAAQKLEVIVIQTSGENPMKTIKVITSSNKQPTFTTPHNTTKVLPSLGDILCVHKNITQTMVIFVSSFLSPWDLCFLENLEYKGFPHSTYF